MTTAPHSPRVVIIGAGPAGLTAALELCRRSKIRPIVLEALDDVGGISRTVEFRNNRMDIGGHRFFSKSDWVMDWWRNILPVATGENGADALGHVPLEKDVMLVRSRLSRIYFLRRFFGYPISLNLATMANLGFVRLARIGISYLLAMLFPRRPERNLEDFFTNRFGSELYRTFFKDYTEKVWGVPCREIDPSWGAQRIKGLSIAEALWHALKKVLLPSDAGLAQKTTETSLIDKFLYPKLGPGQMWQKVADLIRAAGGEIVLQAQVESIEHDGERIVGIRYRQGETEETKFLACDALVSTMPVKDLVAGLNPPAPPAVCRVAAGLLYRDFITIGVLARKLRRTAYTPDDTPCNLLPDNWIYIQEPDVKVGRLQIFNNWSPALVADATTAWLGLEYFCQEGDELWNLADEDLGRLAAEELAKIGLMDGEDMIDFHVVRVPKAYPAYFGTYNQFPVIRDYTDHFGNLYLVGRNGMHRYNNQDHSMVTAKLAVDAILSGTSDKAAIWSVNLEAEYHEAAQEPRKQS